MSGVGRASRATLVIVVAMTGGGCCRCLTPSGSSPGDPAPAASATPPTSRPRAEDRVHLSLADFGQDPSKPVRGALVPVDLAASRLSAGSTTFGARGTRFVPHEAVSVASVGDGSTFLVHANTGVWLHETDSLARKARVAEPWIMAMAASPDGTAAAWAHGAPHGDTCTITVVSLPAMKTTASFARLHAPTRLRFSEDGKRLVIASQEEESVTLVDLGSKRALSYDVDEEVNDAVALPDGDQVAWVDDGDEVGVVSMSTHKKTFSGSPYVSDLRSRGVVDSFFMRDQIAVAFDPARSMLLAGGEDNKLWRFEGIGGAVTTHVPLELDGNVEEILVAKDSSLYVALDTPSILKLDRDGAPLAELYASGSAILSNPIRIAAVPGRGIVGALDGGLVLFEPGTRAVKISPDYPRLVGWSMSVTDADTVLGASAGGSAILQRVVHDGAAADVAATIVGKVDIVGAPAIFALSGKARAILGGTTAGALRVVFLEEGGQLEAPIDVPAKLPGQWGWRPDGRSVAFLDGGGALFEISSVPRAVREIGRAPVAPARAPLIEWDAARLSWKVSYGAGNETTIATGAP